MQQFRPHSSQHSALALDISRAQTANEIHQIFSSKFPRRDCGNIRWKHVGDARRLLVSMPPHEGSETEWQGR